MVGRSGTWPGLVLILSSASFAAPVSPDEAAAVKAAFDDYKQAILAQDGKTAVGLVDKNTIKYYGKMRDLALHGNRAVVGKLSTMDKMMVLTIRHRVPLQSLQTMTPESLFTYAVEHGWIGKQSVVNNELGDVAVSGNAATGEHISRGRKSSIKWTFHKEGGRWKIDLTSTMPAANQALKEVIRRDGRSEDEVLIGMLESVSGTKVPDTIWDPMVR